jgi:hypothetical protein
LYLNKQPRAKASSAFQSEHLVPKEQYRSETTALRIDFVARPGDESGLPSDIGQLLQRAGLHREGLQVSMLLVSDREARLVSLLTLWDAQRFNAGRERLTSWVVKIIAGVSEGPVRAYTSFAHFLLPESSTKLTLSDLRPTEIAELVEIVTAG